MQILKLIFLLGLSLFLTFSTFAKEHNAFLQIDECIPFSEDLKNYSKNLNDCFEKNNLEFDNDFISSLRKNLPQNFFSRVNFGDKANKFISEEFVAKNPEITIYEYVKKFPNQIYAIDSILRGKNAIISKNNLSKLNLLPDLFTLLPAKTSKSNLKEFKKQKQESQIAGSLFLFFAYIEEKLG